MSIDSLLKPSQLLIKKFNICLERYYYYISEIEKSVDANDIETIEVLKHIKTIIKSDEQSYFLLESVMDKLGKFSETYNVDIENIDDFKLVYFIAYHLLEEDEFCKDKDEKKIILEVLHLIMCKTLLVYEPESILNKVKLFIQNSSFDKFKEEYGDIGYYHMIKSTYLMQKASARLLMDETILESENSLIASYFAKVS